jgi:4-methylaminobutanoate oxidase (formaldehyde-forming)
MTGAESEIDVSDYRAWRFGGPYRDTVFAAEKAREVYRYYYRRRYPLDTAVWGRGRRLSPLHGRLEELGAVFGTKNGWERADHFEPGSGWRRGGEDQRAFGFTRPPWFEAVGDEHQAIRDRVGIIDLSSFGKIAVSGPGALELLERVCDNRIDRPVGSVVYTQMLDRRGGIVADLTVTRIAEDRFRLVTGAGAVDADRGWLELHASGDVDIRDESDDVAVIGVWGPRVREVLDVDLPFGRATTIELGGAPVLVQRITFVGELGFELYVPPEWAVQVWDRLMAAGAGAGIRPGGYRVLESLRIEKGYRYYGSDLTASDTPYEGGVGFCVADGKDFIGAQALRDAVPRHRLRTVLLGDGEYVPVYGGEAVLSPGGDVIGRVRTAAYGYTVGRHVALATVPPGVDVGARVQVEALGEPVAADVAPDVLYDPESSRVRG